MGTPPRILFVATYPSPGMIPFAAGIINAFYEAGHIPGAMMVLFEYGGRKILYSGRSCSPCFARTCPRNNPECMTDIPAETAIAALEDLF